ncbi:MULTISPECIES: aldehyde dehydrogenase family protein [unclassified Mycobacterium]|uniref:aldehyde dehydrogenase family protein n=1 Tax=unclassified Mycobacterium TaxID=2642494 RepID=UPI0029C8E76B|nr:MULTISPECIES: aldehyde dehydrogenase family protein [unclassified Mycobacterium]
MLLDTQASLPTDEIYNRNFIDGQWVFPAAPYEYEIRNPADSTISAVVPLSSRNDVRRALAAARQSQNGPWADPAQRHQMLAKLLNHLAELAPQLARLQTTETGLEPADSVATIEAALRLARTILTRTVIDPPAPQPGVTGHILSWGLPFTGMLTNVFNAWTHGASAVVKPSLRGPLTPVAIALAASHVGFPPGAINVVQGTGVDVGAALIGCPDLTRLNVHGNDDTLSRARRATPRTQVPLSTLSAGGNAAIVYPYIASDRIASLAVDVAAAVRIHNAGGPFGLPIVALHTTVATQVLEAIMAEVTTVRPAPLPTEPLRRRAMTRLDMLRTAGARVLAGATIPDDIEHRMGWRIPATVVNLGDAQRAAPLLRSVGEPLGPILTVAHWTTHQDLDALFAAPRHLDGYAGTWGDSFGDERIRFGVITREQNALDAAHGGLLPSTWIGETAARATGAP